MFLSGSDKFVFHFLHWDCAQSLCFSRVAEVRISAATRKSKGNQDEISFQFPPALGCISFKERAIFHFSRQCRSSRSVWRVLWFSCDEGPQPHCAYICLHTIQEMNVHVCTHIYRHFCINSKHGPFNIRTHQYTNTHTLTTPSTTTSISAVENKLPPQVFQSLWTLSWDGPASCSAVTEYSILRCGLTNLSVIPALTYRLPWFGKLWVVNSQVWFVAVWYWAVYHVKERDKRPSSKMDSNAHTHTVLLSSIVCKTYKSIVWISAWIPDAGAALIRYWSLVEQ